MSRNDPTPEDADLSVLADLAFIATPVPATCPCNPEDCSDDVCCASCPTCEECS